MLEHWNHHLWHGRGIEACFSLNGRRKGGQVIGTKLGDGFPVDAAGSRKLLFRELVPDAPAIMGVKAVFGRVTSRVMCFGARGTPDQHGRYYQAARSAAERASSGQRLLVTIGGGAEAPRHLDRRVLNVVSVSSVYGRTAAFVADEDERARLSQWPTAVALHDVYQIEDSPHLIEDLGFPDARILENAFDMVVRPEERLKQLVAALHGQILTLVDLPPILDFYDEGKPFLAGTALPRKITAEEGKRLTHLAQRLERDPALALEVKQQNKRANDGLLVCEGCAFSDVDAKLFDAHHLVPLSIEARKSTPSDFAVLCPTCHRICHRLGANMARPMSIPDLKRWWRSRDVEVRL